MSTTEVYKPVASVFDRITLPTVQLTATKPSIEGNSFAVLRNGWKAMEVLSGSLRDHLLSLGAVEVYDYVIVEGEVEGGAVQQAPPELLDQIAFECVGAISGLGH